MFTSLIYFISFTATASSSSKSNAEERLQLYQDLIEFNPVLLVNRYQNCYGNALFQCLYRLINLVNYVFSCKDIDEDDVFILNLFDIFRKMHKESSRKEKKEPCDISSNIRNMLLKTEDFENKWQHPNCVIEIFELIINRIFRIPDSEEGLNFLYIVENPYEIRNNFFYELFIFEHQCIDGQRKLEDFIYRAVLKLRYDDTVSFQTNVYRYFEYSISCIHCPKIAVFCLFGENGLPRSFNIKVAEEIEILKIKYNLKSYILHIKDYNSHFIAKIIANNDIFVLNDTFFRKETLDFGIIQEDVYMLFYERNDE